MACTWLVIVEFRAAGADVFVAGHAVFRASDPHDALGALRAAVAG